MTKYENKWKDFIQEACWDGYKRVAGTEDGEPGSCEKITEEESDIEEGKICDKGISYVLRTDPGGKDIHRGDKDTDGDGEKEIKIGQPVPHKSLQSIVKIQTMEKAEAKMQRTKQL